MHRNRLGAGAHFQRYAVVVQQQLKLFAVIGVEQIGAGDRGLKAPGPSHKAVTQTRALGVALARYGVGLHPHQRVTGPHMAQCVVTRNKAAHGIAQMGDGLPVNPLYLGQRVAGAEEALRGDEGWLGQHAAIVPARFDRASLASCGWRLIRTSHAF